MMILGEGGGEINFNGPIESQPKEENPFVAKIGEVGGQLAKEKIEEKPLDNSITHLPSYTTPIFKRTDEDFDSIINENGEIVAPSFEDIKNELHKYEAVGYSDGKHGYFTPALIQYRQKKGYSSSIFNITVGGKTLTGIKFGGELTDVQAKWIHNAVSEVLAQNAKMKAAKQEEHSENSDTVSVKKITPRNNQENLILLQNEIKQLQKEKDRLEATKERDAGRLAEANYALQKAIEKERELKKQLLEVQKNEVIQAKAIDKERIKADAINQSIISEQTKP
jgi:hypothetical protein